MSDDNKIRIEKATKIFNVYKREGSSQKKWERKSKQIKKSLLYAVKDVEAS